ncbi:MAG TPA: VWA domain-containing protein [Oceanospirillales bacterium]|nr:VWA domain-containing protein [Oceanospirillales bacterium]
MQAELSSNLEKYQQRFKCKFPDAIEAFEPSLKKAKKYLNDIAIFAYLDGANFLCSIGQGAQPVLVYLKIMPKIAAYLGTDCIKIITDYSYKLARSPNKKALIPFLYSLKSVCRRIKTIEELQHYLTVLDEFVDKTQTVIHGHHSLYESSGMVPLLQSMGQLISKLSIQGLANFIDYGARNYVDSPDEQMAYFSLESHDAKSIINREREGTSFKSVEHKLNMAKESLWDCDWAMTAFSTSFDQIRVPQPYLEEEIIAVPDVFEDENGISGINRYRTMLAHLMAHRRWSNKLMADNYAPQMQLIISAFEDSRVDRLAMRLYPGLKKYFLALHAYPAKNACEGLKVSTIRYRATRLSRALIDADFDPEDELIQQFREKFNTLIADGKQSSTLEMSKLGTKYFIASRQSSDSLPEIFFDNTEVSYRDDNRYFCYHYEEYDEADEIVPNEYQNEERVVDSADSLPPRFYDEWDYISESYRPDWTTVYERLHPAGDASKIDNLLKKHDELAKRLKRLIELLKPQNKKRIRFQEEGSELDLDIALGSLIDLKNGQVPDLRINYSTTTDSRNIAVMLLVDSSESLNQINPDTGQTLLELSQEALAITAWTVDKLGDKFAIAGFNSNTRSEVRYQHIKGFSEKYGQTVKSRIAKMKASYSTRMGAAMRHAAHYLSAQKCEKKLLLVLTDGEPADIDAKDPKTLIKDTKKCVEELKAKGIFSYCITLDKDADEYVSDIFSNSYTVIDHVKQLPEKLPKIFMKLTQ